MNKSTTSEAYSHAIAEYPRESCGLVVAKGRKELYFPCKNQCSEPGQHFIMSAKDYAAAEDEGKVIALVHSHPNETSKPSDADKTACEASGLTWYIISVYERPDKPGKPVEVVSEHAIKPSGWRAPLLGREFTIDVLDCYTLVQDWYKQEMDIDLPDAPIHGKFWERGEDLYVQNFRKWGFSPIVGPMQRGDVILMQIRSTVINHAGVFLGDVLGVGSNLFIHHLYGHLSTRDVYGGYWADNTRLIVRKDEP